MLTKRTKPGAVVTLILSAAMLAMAAGCSSGSGGGAGSAPPAANQAGGGSAASAKGPVDPSKTIEYSAMMPFWSITPDPNSPIKKKFEEITNTKVNGTFVPAGNLLDKINVALASGSMPDVLVAIQGNGPSGNSPGIISAAKAGAFWEIGPYLDRFPNLKKTRTATADANIAIDGKIYGLYKPADLSRKGFNVRQDWLDKLGLKVPTTTDELYQVLKAFAQQDPDGDGKADTVGVEDRLNTNGMPESFDALAPKFGVPNKFALKDGKLTPDFMTPEYLNALDFYHKLYAEKLMNSDFAYVKTNQVDEAYARGQAGVYIGNVDEAAKYVTMFKNFPNAKLTSFANLQGPGGDHAFASWGYNTYSLFPKSSVKTEDRLLELLSALDRSSDISKLTDLSQLGIEGVTYKMENGKPVITDKTALNQTTPVFTIAPIAPPLRDDMIPAWQADMKAAKEKDAQMLVANPAAALLSQTLTERGAELQKIVSDASVRYILGDLNKDGFQKEIDKWKSQGGDKVLQELTSQLKK